ncbi:MAG: hypothetical protein LBI42_10415 [Chitinispirillales bacterium]|jgi:hypothetical protein|nr:hypothetical protein [Chitinispirillales bacterium]
MKTDFRTALKNLRINSFEGEEITRVKVDIEGALEGQNYFIHLPPKYEFESLLANRDKKIKSPNITGVVKNLETGETAIIKSPRYMARNRFSNAGQPGNNASGESGLDWLDNNYLLSTIFSVFYLSDFDGSAKIAPVEYASKDAIITKRARFFKPTAWQSLIKVGGIDIREIVAKRFGMEVLKDQGPFLSSTEKIDALCRQLAEFMCFMHFPGSGKTELIQLYASMMSNFTPGAGGAVFLEDIANCKLPNISDELRRQLVDILFAERNRLSITYNYWWDQSPGTGIDSDGYLTIFDCGFVTPTPRHKGISAFCVNNGQIAENVIKHYIDIYSAKHANRK